MFRAFASRLGLTKQPSAITGQVMAVEERLITGLVHVNGKLDTSLVSVQVNGVAAPVSVSFEPSVSAKHPGVYAFKAEFGSRAAFSEGDSITVGYGSPRVQLAGSPWCIRREVKNDFDYAFLHIPKTAGTSLRFALETALGARCVFPCQAYLERSGRGYPSAQEAKLALAGVSNDVKVLQGHFRLRELRGLAPNAKTIAVFRDPVRRVVSLIKHKMAAAGHVDAAEEYLLQAYLYGKGDANNGQLRTLVKQDTGIAEQEWLEQGAAALNQLDIFGVSENYKDVLARVGKLVGKPLKDHPLNRSRVADRRFSEHFISEVRKANRLDIELYKAVKLRLKSGG